jgi:hypothetical protein
VGRARLELATNGLAGTFGFPLNQRDKQKLSSTHPEPWREPQSPSSEFGKCRNTPSAFFGEKLSKSEEL